MSFSNALAARIRSYILELAQVVNRVELLSGKAVKTGDDGYWDGVALNLHSFYNGVERIFEDIARSFDESVPEGSDWHRALLFQVASEVVDKRPAILTPETRLCLDEYRGFRHVVRNVYAFNFRPARLMELAEALNPCFERVKQDLDRFIELLESLV